MSLIVFSGPSLGVPRQDEFPREIHWRGPARCGDVYQAAQERPSAIVLLDGYFDHELSVWHKEVLWAIQQGVRVYGAASMGALRATELHTFGMIGVGKIFEHFRDGELEDDDEVAVVHESAERGYTPCSEAMVNIRATLRDCVSARLIDARQEQAVVAAAKAMFYPDRQLCSAILAAQLPPDVRARVLSRGRVDQKRIDARAAIRLAISELSDAQSPPRRSAIRLEETNYWLVFARRFGERVPSPPQDPTAAALERALALSLARLARAEVDPDAVQAASEEFRRRRGLLSPDATTAWLAANNMDVADLTRRAREDVLVARYSLAAKQAGREQMSVVAPPVAPPF